MARMWMLPLDELCPQHRRGAHAEQHMVCGAVEAGKLASLRGLAREGFIYLPRLRERHAELEAAEGWDSPLPDIELPDLGEPIDLDRSRRDLVERCEDCRRRIVQ